MKDTEFKQVNIVISHNRLIVVDEITDEDIKAGGRMYSGVDEIEQVRYKIHNKDDGKSAELMRYLIEDERGGGGFNFIKILFWLSIIVSLLILIPLGYKAFGPDDEIEPTVLVNESRTVVVQEQEEPIQDQEEPEEDVSEGVFQLNNPISTFNDCAVENNRHQLASLNYEIDLERERFRYIRLEEQLNTCNSNLTTREERIRELSQDNLNLETQINNIPETSHREDFLLHLGTQVSNKCDTDTRESIQENCKELYYKFLENDQ